MMRSIELPVHVAGGCSILPMLLILGSGSLVNFSTLGRGVL